MNPPEDDDRRNTILEQWWPGLLGLALWVLFITLFFAARTCIHTFP